MPLEILTFTVGPLDNNTYLLADTTARQATVIDPGYDSPQLILDTLSRQQWALSSILLTHAHFDHIAGVKPLAQAAPQAIIALHPLDLPLYLDAGWAAQFGFDLPQPPRPQLSLQHQQVLQVGQYELNALHTPGHSAGHVAFAAPTAGVVFTGDLIFYRGIGRTDLPGGSERTLLESIRNHIFTLPPETRLLSGHGPETTVGEEMAENPFL